MKEQKDKVDGYVLRNNIGGGSLAEHRHMHLYTSEHSHTKKQINKIMKAKIAALTAFFGVKYRI